MLAATLLCYFFSKMKLRRHVLRNILIKHCLTTNHMSCNLYTHFCRASAYWRAILIQQICPSVCLSVRPSVRYVPVQDENGLTCRHSFLSPYGSSIILVLPASITSTSFITFKKNLNHFCLDCHSVCDNVYCLLTMFSALAAVCIPYIAL